MTETQRWIDAELRRIDAADRRRTRRPADLRGPRGTVDDVALTSFAGNDYLGLSDHPAVLAAAADAVERYGAGATASRLVVGDRPVHHDLERALATWSGTDDAVVLTSGYAANLAVLTTFAGPDCLVVSDELNHASIIDGCRLSRAEVAVARHGDAEHVDALLTGRSTPRALVVTDAVFSMDGDEAPVEALAEVCARHEALLVLDEAHAVLGPDVAALGEVEGLDLLRVHTLSKALGAQGGAVAGSAAAIALLVNTARSFIFTTGLAPSSAAAALAALEVCAGPEGGARRARLASLVERVAPGHSSPIVPLVVGEEAAALAVAARLRERGLLVPAIRPPTVPEGTSRLRVSLSAAHTDAEVDALLEALAAEGLATTPVGRP